MRLVTLFAHACNYTLWLGACPVSVYSTQLLYNDRLQKQRRLTTCAVGATQSFLLAGHLYLALEGLNKRFHQETATC